MFSSPTYNQFKGRMIQIYMAWNSRYVYYFIVVVSAFSAKESSVTQTRSHFDITLILVQIISPTMTRPKEGMLQKYRCLPFGNENRHKTKMLWFGPAVLIHCRKINLDEFVLVKLSHISSKMVGDLATDHKVTCVIDNTGSQAKDLLSYAN